jgi:soluble cytochrome b562
MSPRVCVGKERLPKVEAAQNDLATMSNDPQHQTATADNGHDKSNKSEDTLIFGSAPSHLFDEIAIRIDTMLTEEVSALPLLPRKKSDEGSKQSGEEILLTELRQAYKKNLDVVEEYCARNVFTIASFNKTKRRKVLAHFLNGEDEAETCKDEESGRAMAVPQSKFEPPANNEELPTAEQIIAMDKEILLARQRLHTEKQRRAQLSRQIARLKGAMESLNLVQAALNNGEDSKGFDELQNKLRKAVEGHQEIKDWNEKAEEVIQLLDQIKAKRGEGDIYGAAHAVTRDADEKERRRVWEEMNGGEAGLQGTGVHGSGEEIASLLKKLREK